MLRFLPWAIVTERLRFGQFHLAPVSDALARGDIPTALGDAVAAVLEPCGHARAVDQGQVPVLRREDVELTADLADKQA